MTVDAGLCIPKNFFRSNHFALGIRTARKAIGPIQQLFEFGRCFKTNILDTSKDIRHCKDHGEENGYTSIYPTHTWVLLPMPRENNLEHFKE